MRVRACVLARAQGWRERYFILEGKMVYYYKARQVCARGPLEG
jgi:hypothetical protein